MQKHPPAAANDHESKPQIHYRRVWTLAAHPQNPCRRGMFTPVGCRRNTGVLRKLPFSGTRMGESRVRRRDRPRGMTMAGRRINVWTAVSFTTSINLRRSMGHPVAGRRGYRNLARKRG